MRWRPTASHSALIVTGVLLLLRLWLDGHLELMYNEAYYALWAKDLAWGYFDHPPMVAVWIRLSTVLFGKTDFGVRALGTLAACAGAALVYVISWQLFANRDKAAFAVLLYSAMLLISAGAIIVSPDTPLLFFWLVALCALVRIYRGGGAGWWLLVGIAMGLALQSKYTALLLGAGIPCVLALVPKLRVLVAPSRTLQCWGSGICDFFASRHLELPTWLGFLRTAVWSCRSLWPLASICR